MAHLHVDADDLWIYESEYGKARANGVASIYVDALPRLLDLFDDVGARSTIFVVGSDLEHAPAREFCRDAVRRGHEIANHTYSHAPRLDRMSRTEKEREIRTAHDLIAAATDVAPVGFRAPGYYLDGDIVEILAANEYLYDTSILPTFLLPRMKLYIQIVSRRRLDKSFGRPRAAVASRRLRRLHAGEGRTLNGFPSGPAAPPSARALDVRIPAPCGHQKRGVRVNRFLSRRGVSLPCSRRHLVSVEGRAERTSRPIADAAEEASCARARGAIAIRHVDHDRRAPGRP